MSKAKIAAFVAALVLAVNSTRQRRPARRLLLTRARANARHGAGVTRPRLPIARKFRSDTRELRTDRKEVRTDRRDLKSDIKAGDKQEAKSRQ